MPFHSMSVPIRLRSGFYLQISGYKSLNWVLRQSVRSVSRPIFCRLQLFLWADDEIDLLKPHIMFLEQKGYEVVTANNGSDAIDLVRQRHFDIVFLDEQMPGISGIEALEVIKREYPNLPVVMITKSEEERIMEDAIGSNIADYLIKPVNPNQILLSLKRNLENRTLRDEKSSMKDQQEFRQISMDLNNNLNFEKKLFTIKIIQIEINLF